MSDHVAAEEAFQTGQADMPCRLRTRRVAAEVSCCTDSTRGLAMNIITSRLAVIGPRRSSARAAYPRVT